MATRGRKPKPATLHLLNGNPSKTNLQKRFEKETDASKVSVQDVPDAPEWLDPVAQSEWYRVAEILIEIRVLTEADVTGLEMYCKSYSRWKEAERQMDAAKSTVFKPSKDSNYLQQLPQVAIAQKYQKLCKEWMSEFGLTPSARARGVKQENEEEVNPMHKMFRDQL